MKLSKAVFELGATVLQFCLFCTEFICSFVLVYWK